MSAANKVTVSPNMKRLDNIDAMLRSVGSESNRLIKEVVARQEMTSSMSATGSNPVEVAWHDFESRATSALGFHDLGWKSEFERQVGFREGVLKVWNQRGKVPHGFMHLCDMIKKASPEKAKKARVGQDEKDAIAALHAEGKTVQEMREAMHERFGDRRDYLNEGPILGIMNRAGLKAKR
jgi:hypothetical protein